MTLPQRHGDTERINQGERQKRIPAYYKRRLLGKFRIDLIVEDLVVVEIKTVERPLPLFVPQLLNYLRHANKPLGLLINFNAPLLKNGITLCVSVANLPRDIFKNSACPTSGSP